MNEAFAIVEVQDFLVALTKDLGEAVHPDSPRGKKISPMEGLGLLLSGGRFGSKVARNFEQLKSALGSMNHSDKAVLKERFIEQFSLGGWDGDPEDLEFFEEGAEMHLNLLLELPQAVDWYKRLIDRRKQRRSKGVVYGNIAHAVRDADLPV